MKYFAILLLSTCTFICGSGQISQSKKLQKNYQVLYPFLQQPANAVFGISFSSGINDSANTAPMIFQGLFLSGNTLQKGGNVSVGNIMMIPDAKGQYQSVIKDKSIVGKTQFFLMEKQGKDKSDALKKIADSLYIPLLLNIYDPPPLLLAEENSIRSGMNFKWIPDLLNPSEEIVISTNYSSSDPENKKLRDNHGLVENVIVVKDNGNIEIPKSLFTDIPKGARLTLTFQRRNYKKKKDQDGEPYIIYAYSSKYFSYTYQ